MAEKECQRSACALRCPVVPNVPNARGMGQTIPNTSIPLFNKKAYSPSVNGTNGTSGQPEGLPVCPSVPNARGERDKRKEDARDKSIDLFSKRSSTPSVNGINGQTGNEVITITKLLSHNLSKRQALIVSVSAFAPLNACFQRA